MKEKVEIPFINANMKEIEQIKRDNLAPTEYDIVASLKQRYSPRIFKNIMLKDEHIAQLFEAVRWSASSNNLQPWRFIYAEKHTDAYNKIVDCLSDFNKSWAKNAPLLMLSVYKKTNENGEDNFHALHDLGLCLGNMTLQAQHLDIGLHHMGGVDWKKAQNVFNVPEDYHINTAIAVGYYGGTLDDLPNDLQEEEIAERERKPIERFAFKNSWIH